MNEDDLLQTLGNLARFDERWDRLAAGTLTPEEDAALRALAATDTEARAAYEAFRPLGPEFVARIAAAIEKPAPPATAPPVAPPTGAPPATLLPFPRRTLGFAGWSAAAAAIAALLIVFVRAPPLPEYSPAEISGGTRTSRGAATDTAALLPGDRFAVALRPQTEVPRGATLEAEAFLQAGGELRRVAIESRFDASGSVKVDGTLDRDLPPGDCILWLIVGRPGAAPSAQDLPSLLAAAPARGRAWVAVPVRLRVEPRAP